MTAVDKYSFNKTAGMGIFLIMPAVLFFVMVASHYLLRIDLFWTSFEKGMSNPQGKEIINALSPIVFMGGSLAALLINIMAVAGLRFQKVNNELVSSLIIKDNVWNLAIIIVSFTTISLMLGYLVAENWQCWVGLKEVC
jgi:hypothetical protein